MKITGLILLAGLVAAAPAQMPTMAAPAAPRVGDALLTCAQIAREVGEILKKKNLGKAAADSQKAACALKRGNMNAANVGAMMAQAQPMMSLMNDPRLMRLAMLAEEKQCSLEEPAGQARANEPDPCGDVSPNAARNANAQGPFQAPTPTKPPVAAGGAPDPVVSAGAPTAPAKPSKTPRN